MNENWQYKLFNILKNKKINRIYLPGTHDSGAYNFITDKTFSKFKNDQKQFNYFRLLSKFTPLYFIIKAWTKTQNQDVFDQLKLGIRSFDLRIFWSGYKKKWFLGHSIAVTTYEKIMNDIIKFIKVNKNEFIVIQIKEDWENRSTLKGNIDAFWKYTKSFKYFYNLIWFEKKIPTYKELLDSGKRIILIISPTLNTANKNYKTNNLFNLKKDYTSKWPNTNILEKSLNSQVDFLKNRINKIDKDNYLNKFVDVLVTFTPQSKDITNDIICTIVGFIWVIFFILLLLFFYFISNNINYLDKFNENKKRVAIYVLILVCCIFIYLKFNCYHRIRSVKHKSIPLHKMFIKMFKKKNNLLNRVSIITFDFPNKQSTDYVISLNIKN